MRNRPDDWVRAIEEELRHARLAGYQSPSSPFLGVALGVGPRPADEALATLERLEERSYWSGLHRAWFLAMLDRFEEAWPLAAASHARAHEQTGNRWVEWTMAEIDALADDHETASRRLEELCEWLEETGQLPFLATYAPRLGRELCALGRHEEAEERARLGREIGGEDTWTQSLWRQVQARIHASRGEHAEAERLARQAVELWEQTQALYAQGDAHCDLAEVLEAAGRRDEAAAALREALERYERKRIIPLARRVRERLAALQPTEV